MQAQIKKEIKPHHRKGAQVIAKIDELTGSSHATRRESIRRDTIVVINDTDKIKTFSPITDDIFNLENEKFQVEKLAFAATKEQLSNPKKASVKLIQMAIGSQFKKPKVVLNLNVENMTPQELIEFMVRAKSSKGEV